MRSTNPIFWISSQWQGQWPVNRKWRPSQHLQMLSMQRFRPCSIQSLVTWSTLKESWHAGVDTHVSKKLSLCQYALHVLPCVKKERNASRLFFWSCGWMRRSKIQALNIILTSDSRPNNQESLGVSSTAKSRNSRSSIAHKEECQLGMIVNPRLSKLRNTFFRGWVGECQIHTPKHQLQTIVWSIWLAAFVWQNGVIQQYEQGCN